MALHKDRIDRLAQLEALVPRHAPAGDCPDIGRLVELMGKHYAHHASPAARRRAIQRDLEELVTVGRIEPVNPGGKPLRYRRLREDTASDSCLWDYARRSIENILKAELPAGQLDAVWQRMLEPASGTGLDASMLRILSDSQRLQPAALHNGVLADVLEALALSRTLLIGYRDAAGKLTRPLIHPQALLQRGPRMYLFAMKNDEALVRMYALHRITSCALGNEPARKSADFDLDREIRRGNADFGDGTLIGVVLRARGYVASLLRECSLSADQRIEDEDEDSDFELRVTATVPATGQLLRWLLGCGDKLQVIAPAALRTVMAAQTAKAAQLYAQDDAHR
jgi:predicted DNA-binding transcriptional regulator YafY